MHNKRYYFYLDTQPSLDDILKIGDYTYTVIDTEPLNGTDAMYHIEETEITRIRKEKHAEGRKNRAKDPDCYEETMDTITDFHQDRDLTPAQAAALDAAAARPPVKIKARDLPSRKKK